MTLDWNWFFSTLSQSTAAIVGIVGAFIIAKIFANQSVFSEKNNKMNSLVVESQRLIDKIGTIDFDWYNKYKNESAYRQAAQEISSLENEDPCHYDESVLQDIYNKSKFSEFTQSAPIIEKLRVELEAHCSYLREKREREERRKEQEERRARGEYGSFSGLSSLASLVSDFQSGRGRKSTLNYADLHSPWAELQKERQLITECYLEAKHHSRLMEGFAQSVKGNPESPPQITWSLVFVVFIFLAGVIYPLTFMPSGASPMHVQSFSELVSAIFTIKGGLLTLLSTSFLLIASLFIYTNCKMRYDQVKVKEVVRLSDVLNYNDNFQYLTGG